MRILTLSVVAGLALLCGCAQTGKHFTNGSGDPGQFILQQALARGARPVTTNNVSTLGGPWRYSKSQDDMVVQLPRERFNDVRAFLRQAFGRPDQEPTYAIEDGKVGWYNARTLGTGLQFGYDHQRTQVTILGGQSGR